MKKIILICAMFLSAHAVYSMSYDGDKMAMNQPDGSSVDVLLYGSEFFMRAESLDGYTLIVDPDTKWICYAMQSEEGKVISAGIPYENAHVASCEEGASSNRSEALEKKLASKRITKKLQYGKKQRDEIINKAKQQLRSDDN